MSTNEAEAARDATALFLRLQDPGEAARFSRIFNAMPMILRPTCEICGELLTESQVRRGARHCGGGCRAKAFEARNPRLYAASVEQLEGELLKRLGKAAGRGDDKAVTVRALTRNVRVLKLTWVKLRSMTPSGKTFMQTLERLVHEAWLSKEGS